MSHRPQNRPLDDSGRDKLSACLSGVLAQVFDEIPSLSDLPTQLYLTWKRVSETSWNGSWGQRPLKKAALAGIPWETLTAAFRDEVARTLPSLPRLVGTGVTGWRQVDAEYIAEFAAHTLLSEWTGNMPDAARIGQFAREIVERLSEETAQLTVRMPLVNLEASGEDSRFELPLGRLRRLSDDELSQTYGGFAFDQCILNPLGAIAEWVAEIDVTVPITDGETADASDESIESEVTGFRADLLKALRLLKGQPVGIARVSYHSQVPTPFVMEGVSHIHDEYIPTGKYVLAPCDLPELCDVLERLSTMAIPQALHLAANRLASAIIRRDPNDKLLDAAIGLEAVLLAQTAEDKYKGEVRHRFAAHYAVHRRAGDERIEAYKVARDLYDLRSRVAHGGQLSDSEKLGGRRVTAHEAGATACAMLREAIMHYLRGGNPDEIENPEYWTRRLFGGDVEQEEEAVRDPA